MSYPRVCIRTFHVEGISTDKGKQAGRNLGKQMRLIIRKRCHQAHGISWPTHNIITPTGNCHSETPSLMQARKAYLLERVLFVAIACTVVFAGLCIYIYLVGIYESHWVSHSFFPCQIVCSTCTVSLY